MNTPRLLVRAGIPVLGIMLLGAMVYQARGARGAAASVHPDSAPAAAVVRAEGRMVAYPGAEVTVGTDFAGRVARVLVQEGDRVRPGQLLAEIDATEQRAALAEARGRVGEADADLRLYETQVRRAEELRAQNLTAQQDLDRAVRDRDAATSRLAVARATVDRLTATVAKSQIISPIGGEVLDRLVEPGATVAEQAPIARVADLGHTRIEAEVDEYDAGAVTLGAAVVVRAEGYEGRAWRGRVEEIPDAVQGRRLKPQDPGRPSDTRVLLVKVALDEPTPLKLGQRVEVEISGR